MRDIKPGDIVRLIGQPMKMTVESIIDSPPDILSPYCVRCIWFDREGEVNRWTFHVTKVELVPTNSEVIV